MPKAIPRTHPALSRPVTPNPENDRGPCDSSGMYVDGARHPSADADFVPERQAKMSAPRRSAKASIESPAKSTIIAYISALKIVKKSSR